MLGYFAAIDDANLETAAKYLDVRNLSQSARQYTPEDLAFGLSVILQRGAWVDVERLSASPEGHAGDNLPSYRDELAKLKTRTGEAQLLLQRVPAENGRSVWKVSNASRSGRWFSSRGTAVNSTRPSVRLQSTTAGSPP